MFDFTEYKLLNNELSINNILSKVSEVILWRFYLGINFNIGICFNAPYRIDNNPSFCIYIDKRGKLMGKDFGRDFYGDIFNYIQMVYSLSLFEACIKINYDFNLKLGTQDIVISHSKLFKNKPLTESKIKKLDRESESIISEANKIQVVVRNFNKNDLQYWNKFGVSYSILKQYNVHCAQRVYCNNKLCYSYFESDPAYVYLFPKTNHVKIYYPLRDIFRFMGNVNNYEDIQGYYQCEVKNKNNNFLILTKSMKDCMTIRNFGIDSMAIHGEKHRFHKDFIRHIKKYYSNIISLYDRDISGFEGAKYLWKEFHIYPDFINKKYKSKDISDLYNNHGSEITNQFLLNLKNKYNATS